MKKLILTLLLFLLLVSPVHADEDPVRVYFERGTACLRDGRYSEAIEHYTKVIELETSNIEALYNRGLAYQKLKCFDRAIEDFTRIIALRPDFTQAYFERGNTYFDKRMDSRAIEDYTKALDLDPGQVKAIYNRGLAYKRARIYDAAHRDFKKVCALGSQAAGERAKELLAVMAAESPAPISHDLEEKPSPITGEAAFQDATSKGDEVSEKLVTEKVPECSEGFLDLGDGTVKDCHTGLIWIKDLTSTGGIKNWHEAVAYCQSKTATYCGTFRLPTRSELETFSKHLSLSENQPFARLRNGFYWTVEDYDDQHAWIVYLFPCANERWNTKKNTFCNVLPVCSLNGN